MLFRSTILSTLCLFNFLFISSSVNQINRIYRHICRISWLPEIFREIQEYRLFFLNYLYKILKRNFCYSFIRNNFKIQVVTINESFSSSKFVSLNINFKVDKMVQVPQKISILKKYRTLSSQALTHSFSEAFPTIPAHLSHRPRAVHISPHLFNRFSFFH